MIDGKGSVRNKQAEARAARNWLVRFRCQLPADLKKAWPDSEILSPNPGESRNGMPIMAVPVREILEYLKVKKSARIIDIGAGFNQVLIGLWASGYKNGVGIDVLGLNGTKPVNFRNLPLDEMFDVIHFRYYLDNFKSRDFRNVSSFNQPLELLAAKIWHHLRFSGYLLYCESPQSDSLHALLSGLGFVRIDIPEPILKSGCPAYKVWQKRPVP